MLNRFKEMHQQIYVGFIIFFISMLAGGQILIWAIITVIQTLTVLAGKLFSKIKILISYLIVLSRILYIKVKKHVKK